MPQVSQTRPWLAAVGKAKRISPPPLSTASDSDKRWRVSQSPSPQPPKVRNGPVCRIAEIALMKLISIPANPVPEGAVTGMLKTPDGISIRFARWQPPPGRKGTVCIFQGRTEFIEKYFEVVRELHGRGFAVATIDWRGQGLSDHELRDPRKGHVTSFAKYVIDLETFMQEIVLPDCPPPFFALANSMGASIMMRAATGRRWFDRMVLCAPMIRLANIPLLPAVPAVVRTMRALGFGNSYAPGGGGPASKASGPFLDNNVTSDPVRHARTAAIIEAEPALALGAPTVAWLGRFREVALALIFLQRHRITWG